MARYFILICFLITSLPVFAQDVIGVVDTVRVATAAGSDSANYYARIADDLMEKEKYLPAYKALTHALHFDHTDSRNYYNRSLCLAHLERYEESLKDLGKALQLAPDNARYWSEQGSVYYFMNNYNAAIKAFEHSLQIENKWFTYSNYFKTLVDAGQFAKLVIEAKKLEKDKGGIPFPNEEYVDDVAFYAGIAFYKTSDWNNALRWYNEAIRINPDFAGYYGNRGNVWSEMKKYTEAILDFNKNIELAPEDGIAYYTRGTQYLELKVYPPALKDFIKAESLGDTSKELYLNKGNALRNLNRPEEALEAYNRALAIDRNFHDAYTNKADLLESMGEHKASARNYQKAVRLDSTDYVGYYNQGNDLLQQGNNKAALPLLEKAYRLNPSSNDVINELAICYEELKRYEDARKLYTKGIQQTPSYSSFYVNRGNTLTRLGLWDSAEADYNTYIMMAPDSAGGYYCRGKYFQKRNYYKKALADFEQCDKMHFRDASFFQDFSSLMSTLGDAEKSIHYATEALKIDPENAEVLNNRGGSYADINEYDLALEDYTAALAIDPQNAGLLYNRGNLDFRQKEYKNAIGWFKKALAADPKLGAAYLNMAQCYEGLGDSDKTMQTYDKGITACPDMADLYFNRAAVKLDRKDTAGAKKDFEQSFAVAEKLNTNKHNGHHGDELSSEVADNLAMKKAEVYQRLEDWDNAVQNFRIYIIKHPDNANALTNLAYCQLETDDITGAKVNFMTSQKVKKDNIDNVLGLVAVSHLLNEKAAEKKYITLMLRLRPDLPQSAEALTILEKETFFYTKKFKKIMGEVFK